MVIYRIATSSMKQKFAHLKECDLQFVPPLSSRVDLLEYSRKLSDKSLSFEAWAENRLVGMINAYFNDVTSRSAYITNVSIVKEYTGMGVASILLGMCFEHARTHGFDRIKLRVSRENIAAITLYLKAGFSVTSEDIENLMMEHELLRRSTQ